MTVHPGSALAELVLPKGIVDGQKEKKKRSPSSLDVTTRPTI
jgi:hypothetical protein